MDTAEDTRLEKVEVGLGALGALKTDLLLDFGELKLHKLVVGVALAVKVRQDLEGLVRPVVVNEPTRRLRPPSVTSPSPVVTGWHLPRGI